MCFIFNHKMGKFIKSVNRWVTRYADGTSIKWKEKHQFNVFNCRRCKEQYWIQID